VKLLKALIPAWIMVAIYAAFCVWARAQLPDAPIVTHFDAHFRPNGWMPRDQALFVPLAICAVLMAIMTLAPFIVPPRGALERSSKAYGAVCFGLAAFLTVIAIGVVARPLGWPVGIAQIMAVGVGALYIVVGNFATKVRPNFIYGVRTPWTLSNEAVWDRTHRFAGPAIMAGGVFIAVAGLLRPEYMMPILLTGVLVPGLAAVVYSWWLWSKLPPEDKRRLRIGA
jgi:uncharacterized membrane protein